MKKYLFLFILLGTICQNVLAREINVYIWSEYLTEDTINQFTKETGIKVNLSTYDSNETMYAKIKLLNASNGGSYDLVMPSTYFVTKMRKENLLHEIDVKKIPNFKNLDDKYLYKDFDPESKFTIPYLAGTTGIAYNSKYIKDPIDSWSNLFDPKYKNKVLLTDEVREVFHVALKLLGYSGNERDKDHIQEAYEKLTALMPNVKLFNSFSPKLNYINEEVMLGMIYSGEAFMAARENPDIKYVIPKEGAILWMDSFAIPTNAKNIEDTYKFLDFLLRPEIAKRVSEEMGFATTNKEAIKLLPQAVIDNPTIFPTKETLEAGEYQADVGDAVVQYEELWEKLKLSF